MCLGMPDAYLGLSKLSVSLFLEKIDSPLFSSHWLPTVFHLRVGACDIPLSMLACQLVLSFYSLV